jgi:hypothetical protein
MILLSACTDTLSACQEQHTKGNDNKEYAKEDKDNKPLDDNGNNKYAKWGWQSITADTEAVK